MPPPCIGPIPHLPPGGSNNLMATIGRRNAQIQRCYRLTDSARQFSSLSSSTRQRPAIHQQQTLERLKSNLGTKLREGMLLSRRISDTLTKMPPTTMRYSCLPNVQSCNFQSSARQRGSSTPASASIQPRVQFKAWSRNSTRNLRTSFSLPSRVQTVTFLRSATTDSKLEPGDGRNIKSSTSPTAALLSKLPTPLLKTTHENIYTLPNFLTLTRFVAAPFIGYAIVNSQPLIALSLFVYAGVTDAVDGYLARHFNSQTVVGTVIDPMADKFLMTIAVVCLTVQSTLPIWLAVIVLGRDVALAISAIYFRWISLPPPKTFTRYWDFSLPSAEVRPTEISKINTLLQLLLIGNAMLLPVLPEAIVAAYNLTGVFEGWCYLVAGTTVWSGASYIGNRDAVKILSQDEGKERQRKALEGKQ